MAKAFSGNTKCKLYIGSTKVKKGYAGNTLVYSAGNVVTYNLDQGVSYKEEIDSGSSCLAPATFTPARPGWTFVGWREDSTASGDVLSSRLMNDDPVDLYAVFQQDVVLTTGMNNAIYSQQTLPKYYNNGNTYYPHFTVTNPVVEGINFLGWSTSTEQTIAYSTINNEIFYEDTMLYAVSQYNAMSISCNVHTAGLTSNKQTFYLDNTTHSIDATWNIYIEHNGGYGGFDFYINDLRIHIDGEGNSGEERESGTITLRAGKNTLEGYISSDTWTGSGDVTVSIPGLIKVG